jgi:hypothetical protein
MTQPYRHALAAAVAVLVGGSGCGGSGSVTTPSDTSVTTTAAGAQGGATALSPETVAALDRTLQDEYHAESTYLGVLGDFGDVRPFANVVYAEQRHSESLARLYENHGLVAPRSVWTLDNVPHFASLTEACAAAAAAERDNVALYDTYLALDLPRDVANVFGNNRAASLERHLPAFQACSCQTCPRS